jgi:hypothetical protein
VNLPAHYFVYMLVLVLGRHDHVSTGTAYHTETACYQAAAEQNKHTNSMAHFQCESLVVLKEGK